MKFLIGKIEDGGDNYSLIFDLDNQEFSIVE